MAIELRDQIAEGFTPREHEILWLIASDLSDKEVARALQISGNTLRTHLSRVYRRHGVHSRAAAVAVWILGVPTLEALQAPGFSGGDGSR